MRYKMKAPETFPEKPHLGLIVYFHGRGGNENSLYGLVTQSLKRLGLEDQYVVMGGKSRADGWEPADDNPVLEWIEWAKKTYPIDPRRVHLVGLSSGAFMVTRFGWEHQDNLASVGSFCGASEQRDSKIPGMKPRGKTGAADLKTEFYMIHGTNDDQVEVSRSRNATAKLADRGWRYIYRELDGHDHGSIARVAEIADDLFLWMHALRLKEVALSKEEKADLNTAKNGLRKATGEEATAYIAELSRIGSHWSAPAISSAMRSQDEAVRLAAIGTLKTTIYTSAVVRDLTKALRDESEAVRLETIAALGYAANWRFEEAQQALVKHARTTSNPIPERVAAIEAMGRSVRLMLRGNLEDGLMPYTLVQLMADPAIEVRTAAFTVFKDRVKDVYGYAPDNEEDAIKESVKRWTDWIKESVGEPAKLDNTGVASLKP